MRVSHRQGKTNPLMIAVLPPLIFVAGLMVYNAYKWAVPSDFSAGNSQRVEALEVLDGISPVAKNGLIIPQPQSLRTGGSSRVVISRPAKDGAFNLITGSVSASFMAEKNPLDRMLHLKFDRSTFRVESSGKPVDAVLLFPRTETKPLRVDMPDPGPDKNITDILFVNQSLLPVPDGITTPGKFASVNGMSVECDFGLGQSGTLNFGDVAQLNFKLDSKSSAWIEMPRSIRVQHQTIGTEDLEIGLLVLRDKGKEPYVIHMFGEEVATISRR